MILTPIIQKLNAAGALALLLLWVSCGPSEEPGPEANGSSFEPVPLPDPDIP